MAKSKSKMAKSDDGAIIAAAEVRLD